MKKRVVALALATVMSLGAVASVGATEEIKSASGSASGDVNAKVTAMELPEVKTYLVTVEIPSMSFEYSFGTAEGWDTTTLKYEEAQGAGWKEDPIANIKVTNKSDAAVNLNCEYKDLSVVTGLSSTITGGDSDGSTAKLESAVNVDAPLTPGEAKEVTFKLELTGTPNEPVEASTKIGTVTLTVSEAE